VSCTAFVKVTDCSIVSLWVYLARLSFVAFLVTND
jgi:hypothetical protein